MKKNFLWQVIAVVIMTTMLLAACAPAAAPVVEPVPEVVQPEAPVVEPPAAPEPEQAPAAEVQPSEFIFGLVLVGPYNDSGWNQAHYEGGLYAEAKVPGAKMIYIDNSNPSGRPGTTSDQLAEDLVSKGAKLIIFNSDDMKDASVDFTKKYPDIPVLHISGDYAWKDGLNFKNLPNYANDMGNMEYGEMIGGCAAAVTTKNGKIGYVGPLINDETRRFANAFYLGAKHCWKEMGKDPKDLKFKVTWIGFWFNIPGVTADPTQVSDEFLAGGYDVLVSALDTMEALIQADKAAKSGQPAWAVAYDYEKACDEAPDACLGVRYFNWGPAYVKAIIAARDGTFAPYWDLDAPDWKDLNNKDTSAIGFLKGNALSAEGSALVDKFIADLGGGLNLFTGPLNWQDGTVYLKDGEVATLQQIWYSPQLLEGMEGQSVQ